MLQAIINYFKASPEVTCALITFLGGFISAFFARRQARKEADARMTELHSTWENEIKKQQIEWQRQDEDFQADELKRTIEAIEAFLVNPFPNTYAEALSALSSYRVTAPARIGPALDRLYDIFCEQETENASARGIQNVREALAQAIQDYRNSKG